MKIFVTPVAKTAIEEFADQYGMSEFVVASRFYEWFAAQDDIYQRAVMGMLHGLEVDAARVFMERFAASGGAQVVRDLKGGVIPPDPQKESDGKRRSAQGTSKRS